jgi:hypothetical protein
MTSVLFNFVDRVIAVASDSRNFSLQYSRSLHCRASRIYFDRQDHKARRAMGLAERRLEYHRYLDDLLPSPSDASPRA